MSQYVSDMSSSQAVAVPAFHHMMSLLDFFQLEQMFREKYKQNIQNKSKNRKKSTRYMSNNHAVLPSLILLTARYIILIT